MAARRGQSLAAPRLAVNDEHFQKAEAAQIIVSDRCEVSPGGRRGTIRQHPLDFLREHNLATVQPAHRLFVTAQVCWAMRWAARWLLGWC